MRSIVFMALLAGLFHALKASSYCSGSNPLLAQGIESRRHAIELERERVSKLLAKGQDFSAWRFTTVSLFDDDGIIRAHGLVVFYRLIAKGKPNNSPARALLEQVLVRSRKLGYVEQSVYVSLYLLLKEAPKLGFVDDNAERRSDAVAVIAVHQKHLTEQARKLCSELLVNPDPRVRRASIVIVLLGAHLTKQDRAWSLDICRQQMHSSSPDNSTVWEIVYETITGRFLAEAGL